MNTAKGQLTLIKSGEQSIHGPWRLYACGDTTPFFAYPGREWTELEALKGKHVELEIKHEGDAWLYVQGTARLTPDAPATLSVPNKQRIVWLACLKAAAASDAGLGHSMGFIAGKADELLVEYEKRFGGA